MKFGFTLKPDITVERIVSLTRQAEAAGFEYGWMFDSHVLWMECFPLMTLMATNVIEVGRKLLTRYPFFISSASEQRMMFSRNPNDTLPPLTIIPTARFVPEGQFGTDLPL